MPSQGADVRNLITSIVAVAALVASVAVFVFLFTELGGTDLFRANPTALPTLRAVIFPRTTTPPGLLPTAEPTAEPPGLLPTAEPTPTPAPAFVKVPVFAVKAVKGVTVKYFVGKGADPSLMQASWKRAVLKVCGTINYAWHTGSTTPGGCISYGRGSWIYQTTSGVCRVRSLTFQKPTIYLPRWAPVAKVPVAWVTWFTAFQKSVMTHELGHFTIYKKWLPYIRGQVLGASCSNARAHWGAAQAKMEAAQEAFDKVEYARTDRYPAWPTGYGY
jgi:hypothetical protein